MEKRLDQEWKLCENFDPGNELEEEHKEHLVMELVILNMVLPSYLVPVLQFFKLISKCPQRRFHKQPLTSIGLKA